MTTDKEKRQSVMFLVIMVLLFIAVAAASWIRAGSIGKIDYGEHLDDVAVTIDGQSYKFRDLAFYLAYQEKNTQEQARVYDLEHTNKYWNLHTNGSFIRIEAKNLAMDMAVHDVIFYQMALEDELWLTKEETDYAENQNNDFWNDLEEEGQKRLGVSEEEISRTFEHMALAQKEQQLLADSKGVDYREYNVEGSMYQELLQEHIYEINEKLWDRLNFGNIILED